MHPGNPAAEQSGVGKPTSCALSLEVSEFKSVVECMVRSSALEGWVQADLGVLSASHCIALQHMALGPAHGDQDGNLTFACDPWLIGEG